MKRSLVLVCGVGLFAFGMTWLVSSGFRYRPAPSEQEDESGSAWFHDVTDDLGIGFTHDPGPTDQYFLPQMTGSGVAVFDYDRDGRLDLFFAQMGGKPCRLYRQLPDGRFQDASPGSGLDLVGTNTGVAVGDVNNDGWPDVAVSQFGGLRLFLNEKGTFRDVTPTSGLGNPNWGMSMAFFDYDRDGWLDLVVVNYLDFDPSRTCTADGKREYCGAEAFPGTVTRLFHNLGPQPNGGVTFEDVTVKAGLARGPGPGMGLACADFDGDGWPDIFVANDGQPNRMWVNRRDGTFADAAAARGTAFNFMGSAQAGRGVACGDVNGDGLMDLFVTHSNGETHALWKQKPRGLFHDAAPAAGLTHPRRQGTGFGAVVADFDNDGAPDIAVVNGHIARAAPTPDPALGPHWGWYADRNQVFANDGRGRFKDVSDRNPDFCDRPNVGRGLARGDLSNRGAVDLVVTTAGGRARVYRNVAPGQGHWLTVRALLPDPAHPAESARARDAHGAEVTVVAGEFRWVRLTNPADSYLSSSDPKAHFGVGASEQVDAIEVLWPDGTRETFPGGAADRFVTLRKGAGTTRQ
ncbi:CRTAC1 family protein [Fimbriiglobus ruber]|uniref:ASPIC/UnbV domain-containing protein n=1 Tax=Fimbriiglobus ruber TaxID=1908690 RepID=A0A225DH15_9BACT|nr:CRTAC1 family protein [Fimbriiglobus ruber]OWK40273.1 hypothetical protein FRUB_05192 [Fimbriiglobus ruber]